ncbi:FAD-dependent monooxygenase [Streptomyces sp. P9(2023)]|uniref:FAD-dependent monooxygenase n=1 Tax=Streptomyces sp. P9(2023) TaxID=3064394 RepID=UPI0028F3FC60|nr:FAD-dependent monooxygenase [Streptomyces sp. P9(2023)]MDT9687555.1 FAD-dependent monooxygenase [Streptomyces sp. P9(2023)]
MDASVIVVGAGPSGLMLAGELRLAGVDVIVLDRLPARTGESRGIGFTIRTMEVFDQRGLLPRFGEIQTSEAGHFGGLPLDLGLLGSAHASARTVPQSLTEAVLESWARDLGADIRRGHEFTGYVEDADGVTVTATGSDTNLRARYLVGCDGGRSRVRKAAGFDFPGTPATTELFLADIRGAELSDRMTIERTDRGLVMVAQLPGGIHRVIVGERGATPLPERRTVPPEFSEVADAFKRLTGSDISAAEPVWVSAFSDAAHQVDEYRRGRVLLAGDAAHIHLPAGGQGMNTSVQDSVNLGWKLAAVVRGTAPPALLDTYHDERHEVGRRLLANTRAQSMLILGGEEAGPVRDILGDLLAFPEVERQLAARVSGLDIRYEVGGGPHPLLGARMPQLRLTHADRSTSSSELLRTGRGLLLDLADNATLRGRAQGWTDRVDVVTPSSHERGDHELGDTGVPPGTAALLLRPDGHVAWAAPGSHSDLPMALARWFGPARRVRKGE